MKLTLLQQLYEKNLIAVAQSFPTWQGAVKASVEPMVRAGMVTEEYGEAILKHVEKYGPYIFLAPHICMPHCSAYEYVKEPGICFMKCNVPVIVDPEDPEMGAELFFAIAAQSEGEHLGAIREIMELLCDEETMDALLRVRSIQELEKLLGGSSCT